MRMDNRASKIEQNTNEMATTVKQYAHNQIKFEGRIRDTERSQMDRLSDI